MADPIQSLGVPPAGPLSPAAPLRRTAQGDSGQEFASMLRGQLEKVSRMQSEADAGVQRLLTGESQSFTEVFTAARKAEVAFSLLIEMRNKLVDAYTELRQMRV